MHRLLPVFQTLAMLGLLCLAGQAQAVTYSLEPNQRDLPPCSGNWTRSNGNTVYTCSGQVTLKTGDVVTAGKAATIRAVGFSIATTTFGSSSVPITVQAGSDGITGTGTNSFSASVLSSSGISLSNATIAGSLTANEFIKLDGGSVEGQVSSVSGAIQLTNVKVADAITANSGGIKLSGGSVIGLVNSDCCDVVINDTNLQNGARSGSSSLSIAGGTIQGAFSSVNNPATFSDVTLVSGTVEAGSISFTNSTVGSAAASVTMTSRYAPITLSAAQVYGDLTAPDYSTVNVTNGSNVYGTCKPNSTPANACKSSMLLLSWWLDETSWSGAASEVLDRSGNGLHGRTFNGAATANAAPALTSETGQGTCRYGSFSSSASQYVETAHNSLLTLQQSFTIGVWVKPRSLPSAGLMSILSKDENYEFHLNPNGTVNWWWQTAGPDATVQFNSSRALTVGQWNHVLIRYAAGDQRIYINGSLAGSAQFSGTPRGNTDPLQLGWDQIAGRHFDGDLDELRIFNGALSDAEIAALVAERHACDRLLQCVSDNFDAGNLSATDWVISSRGATPFTPVVVDGRLRLTSNQGNVATATALQRLFPAAGNYIQVEFDYYAYDGTGADGIALILSDATQTPQPGGYGGSLGYAQLNGTNGFAGGWLGVALDEFGNFSNPTEGRQGGPRQIPDSVSLRGSGSGTTGYRYLRGTEGSLNPSVDSAGSKRASPGHRYRITVDGRNGSQSLVTVERRIGSAYEVLPNLNAYDVMTAGNLQDDVPERFYLSLTGSTGGSTNIHEIDNLQVCATEIEPVGQQIHHFDLRYSSPSLTCNPQDVTVTACLNEDCSRVYEDEVAATLTATNEAVWHGGNGVTFSGGSTQLKLQVTKPGEAVIDVGGSTPPARSFGEPTCSTPDCKLFGVESGFVFDVPTLIANRPQAEIALRAVKTDPNDPQRCVAGFGGGEKTIQFSSSYDAPATGSKPVVVNGAEVRAEPVDLLLKFDDEAKASLSVRYADAGSMVLNAFYAPMEGDEAGLEMRGADSFLSKPYGICIETDIDLRAEQAERCNEGDFTDSLDSCPVFTRARDEFPVRFKAVGWEADGEPLVADQLCTGNGTTPNFQMAGIALSNERVAPSPGADAELGVKTYDDGLDPDLGDTTTVENQWVSEVGIFKLLASPSSLYFGETVGGGESNLVGRFIPARLEAAGAASLAPSCGSFSYQNQPMSFAPAEQPRLTVTAYNSEGEVTRNYDRGPFWRLDPPARDDYVSVVGKAALDARLKTLETATLEQDSADDGDGSRVFRWTGEQLTYVPAERPGLDDLPFTAEIQQTISAGALTDRDEVCYAVDGACQAYSYAFSQTPGSEVRLGRLRIGNVHGSELQGLDLPMSVESWQAVGAGAAFITDAADTCTTSAALGLPALQGFTGSLDSGDTAASVGELTAGQGVIRLSAPGQGNHGSVQVTLPDMPSWLRHGWDGGSAQSARGIATFGVHKGSPPLIFRREVYR
jgi:MSHA biogenesis protein MshQ